MEKRKRKASKLLPMIIPAIAIVILPLNSIANLVLSITILVCLSIVTASIILDSEEDESENRTFNMVFKTRK